VQRVGNEHGNCTIVARKMYNIRYLYLPHNVQTVGPSNHLFVSSPQRPHRGPIQPPICIFPTTSRPWAHPTTYLYLPQNVHTVGPSNHLFVSSPQRPHRGPIQPPIQLVPEPFPATKGPESDADHWPLSSDEVKNEGSYKYYSIHTSSWCGQENLLLASNVYLQI